MKFFFDHNLSHKISDGLKAFGENVVHLTELFDPEEKDAEWLQYIGENNLFLITRDERIRYRPAEIKALKQFKVGAFFIGGKNKGRCEIIRQVVRNWPRIKEYAIKNKRPFIFRVPPTGSKFTSLNL